MADQTKKKKIIRNVIYYGLLVIFAAIFIGSAIYIVDYFSQSSEAQDLYSDLAAIKNNAANAGNNTPTKPNHTGTDATDPSGSQGGILPEYKDLYAMNNDLVGWITVPGTVIDYPVMQTPTYTDYYLYRDFNKAYSNWGTIYVRETCDVFTPSDNVTIYGHRMNDGTMFAALHKYLEKSFWEEHRTVIFDTLYEHHTYEIMAVFKTSANVGQGFPYHKFEVAKDQAEFDEFVKTAKELSIYDTGVDAEYGDMLISLSTCTKRTDYSVANGRLVVIAKRVS